MKYATRRIAASSRARTAAATARSSPSALDSSGSSAARDRHPEEAHRQRVEDLRVAERRDRAERQQAREQLVEVGAHLQHAAAHEGGREVAEDGPHAGVAAVDAERHATGEAQRARQLDRELRAAADHGAPRDPDRQVAPALRSRPKSSSAPMIAAFQITGAA